MGGGGLSCEIGPELLHTRKYKPTQFLQNWSTFWSYAASLNSLLCPFLVSYHRRDMALEIERLGHHHEQYP